MKRRALLQAGVVGPAALAIGRPASGQTGTPQKVFRWAFPAAETGFDPAQISDLYSNYVISHIFEAPLQYDYLARPAIIKPRTAAALPEISADFRSFTVRIRPGIFFQDDPVFLGKPRELTAADHIYQLKRVADPRWKSPLWPSIESSNILGLAQARKAAQASGRFDYDAEIEGVRLLDRFTFQIRLTEPSPRFGENLTDARVFAGVAREVVDAYEKEIMGKPVGTGPFRLFSWTRASRIVLERNPAFRDEFYDGQPAADDARAQATLARLKGRKLPMVDRVEISVIEESQPRWLSFLNGQQDTVNVPLDFINIAAPNGKDRAGAGEERHRAGADHQSGRRCHLLQHGASGGRRLHAGKGGAAPGDQPGLQHRGGDPPGPAWRHDDGALTGAATDAGL
jgi:ABC-type transport system substrate-binding protein